MRLRRLIASQLPSYELSDEVEADESYFGGVAGVVAVFGLLKRKGKVFTAIVPNDKAVTLLPIIKEQVRPDSIVYTDTFKACNALSYRTVLNYLHDLNYALKVPRPQAEGTDEAQREAFVRQAQQWQHQPGLELWSGWKARMMLAPSYAMPLPLTFRAESAGSLSL
jgi:hypothetical protein